MVAQPIWSNDAITTLASSVSNSATTIPLAAGTGSKFPSPTSGQIFPLTLISATNPATFEITYCTARSGDSCTVIRGQEGTSAVAWNAGDLAQNLVTAGTLLFLYEQQFGSQSFSSSGTFTVPVGVYSIDVEMWGGGGPGGNTSATGINTYGGPGGGAGYCAGVMPVTPGQAITVTVGIAGVSLTGASGGTSTMTNGAGVTFTATGGTAGDTVSGPAVGLTGNPGTASGGAKNFHGTIGPTGYPVTNTVTGATSSGGASFGSGLGIASVGSSAFSGFAGQFPGQGGGGGIGGGAGGNGGAGLVIIKWY